MERIIEPRSIEPYTHGHQSIATASSAATDAPRLSSWCRTVHIDGFVIIETSIFCHQGKKLRDSIPSVEYRLPNIHLGELISRNMTTDRYTTWYIDMSSEPRTILDAYSNNSTNGYATRANVSDKYDPCMDGISLVDELTGESMHLGAFNMSTITIDVGWGGQDRLPIPIINMPTNEVMIGKPNQTSYQIVHWPTCWIRTLCQP
jgi:hypothetical protein